jgi:Icc-related predicted phosphoesterase
MRVCDIDERPFSELPYLNALGGGRVAEVVLPFIRARAEVLPRALGAVVCVGDMQGRERVGGWRERLRSGDLRLLGEAVAEHLLGLAHASELPDPAEVGVLLAGDLYTPPQLDRRGKSGDVRPVWAAFARRFRWVAGVLGNHDMLGEEAAGSVAEERAHVLDGQVRDLDGLRVGGVGGIIGSPTKLNRKTEAGFLGALDRVVSAGADVVVLHEGPDVPGRPSLAGSASIREHLELMARSDARVRRPLVVCGHSWWPEPLVELPARVQVLKVDARVVVLVR